MIERDTLLALYQGRHLSMAETAHTLGTTHATVLYWLKRYGIARRSWSESTYVKLHPDGDPFQITSRLTRTQQELTAAALALHWAEGSKKRDRVQIGNLDAEVLQLFAQFLRQIGGVEEDKLKVYVRVNQPFPLGRARRYWARKLALPARQVRVYRHTDSRSEPTRQTSAYGVATLEFHNVKFRRWLDEQLAQLIRRHRTLSK